MSIYSILVKTYDEVVDEAKRLGRHVEHDARSLWYLFDHDQVKVPVASVQHPRLIPILDQENLGSCTGNAAVGALGTSPTFEGLPSGTPSLDEAEAVAVYSMGTTLDNVSGSYPPNDTGSTGLAVAKACQRLGFTAGYQHVTGGVPACKQVIQVTPFIIGIDWYESFDQPDDRGLVSIGGQIRGGHEVLVRGYDVAADTWTLDNSWGASWGVGGSFAMGSETLARLLADDGDATVLVPRTAPKPTPTPTPPPPPTPAPGPTPPIPTPDEVDRAFWTQAQNWARAKGIS